MSKKALKLRRADPPVLDRRDYQWEQVAKRLRADPGVWYVVHEDLPTSTTDALRQGKIAPVRPTAGFESRTAGNTRPAGGTRMTGELFMRYVPALDQSKSKRNGGEG